MNTIIIQTEAESGEMEVVKTVYTLNAVLICNAHTIKLETGLYETLGYDVDLTGDNTIVHLEVVEIV